MCVCVSVVSAGVYMCVCVCVCSLLDRLNRLLIKIIQRYSISRLDLIRKGSQKKKKRNLSGMPQEFDTDLKSIEMLAKRML